MPRDERGGHQVAVRDGDGQGADFRGMLADLMVGVGEIREHQQKPTHPRIPWEACHPVWQSGQIPLAGGAGQLIQTNLYGPQAGYWWDVRSVSVWGFTAGTVTLYLNSYPNGEQVGVATTPGQFTWSAQLLLGPQDDLLFGATGVTGSVFVTMRAIEVETKWLAEYLM